MSNPKTLQITPIHPAWYKLNMIRWKLKHLLDQNGLTAYRLVQELQGKVSKNTVYSLARGEATRVDLPTLNAVLCALRHMLNQKIGVGDLFFYEEEEIE